MGLQRVFASQNLQQPANLISIGSSGVGGHCLHCQRHQEESKSLKIIVDKLSMKLKSYQENGNAGAHDLNEF